MISSYPQSTWRASHNGVNTSQRILVTLCCQSCPNVHFSNGQEIDIYLSAISSVLDFRILYRILYEYQIIPFQLQGVRTTSTLRNTIHLSEHISR